jgi:hypothetical protein
VIEVCKAGIGIGINIKVGIKMAGNGKHYCREAHIMYDTEEGNYRLWFDDEKGTLLELNISIHDLELLGNIIIKCIKDHNLAQALQYSISNGLGKSGVINDDNLLLN